MLPEELSEVSPLPSPSCGISEKTMSGPTVEQLTVDLGAAKHCLSHGLAQQWLWCAVNALAEYRKRKPKYTHQDILDPTDSSNGTQQGFF